MKMKISVVFHSVCGNTYLLAKEIYESFLSRGIEVSLYRVKDDDLESISQNYHIVKEYMNEILQIPICNIENLLDSDYIFLGSPTYFGNVSGEMKSFMDSFSPFWSESKLFGKKLVSFTISGTPEGGGESCLKAINIFGQHLGLINVPIPSNINPNKSNSAYGLIHYTSGKGDVRIGEDDKVTIDKLADIIVNKL